MITRRQSLTGLAALGAGTFGLAGCSGLRPNSTASDGGGAQNLVLGHAGSETDPRQQGSEKLKELIEERTEGRLTVEINANSTLGSWEQMVEGLQLGTTHIVIESILALEAYSDLAAVETAPFLYESDEQFLGVWDGALGDEIKTTLTEETGFELLGNMFRGARNLTVSQEVAVLEDLQGLTIRTPSTQTMVDTWQMLGARAEAMAWDEVYSALEQGVIDGQENPLDVATFNALYEVQPRCTLTQHMYANYHFLMWGEALAKFSQEDQQIIREAADEVGSSYTERTVTNLEEYRTTLEDEGMTFVELEDRDAWVEKVEPIIEELPDQVTAWVEQIRGGA
ncbi:TRAP transporter substrate-binding protein [Brachybacterium sacelli]|uniref:Tripartite ATP-independent transporter DctP family solute receptor n=1 Tax=Brachybacterium sacelli TaxID=173364 RepID=A0ABS4WZ11_9MICO|nr:TRAP transporter substrate-binding protein [Brachybacterium sacelli]MBP2381378.1 tripartite ATP-independent transporter DctP family solute receptor [Brachybacterium sacelli]